MDSFEDLGTPPELVEALAAEGIERPTALQEAAIPVMRRGNNTVLRAGPGAGTLVAWAAALLERVSPDGTSPGMLVLTPTPQGAERVAESLARLGVATGHAVAALGSPWALPGRARVVVGVPTAILSATLGGDLSLADVQAVVVDQAEGIEGLGGLDDVEQILSSVSKDGQRVVCALPLTPAVEGLVERHVRRATVLPAAEGAPIDRGILHYRVASEPKDEGVLRTVAELFTGDARHVLVYCRSEDRAADLGDYLSLHGFAAGAPGDEKAPVWLGVDGTDARARAQAADQVLTVSADVPADPDTMDRRHHGDRGGVVIVLPRELAHLRDVATRTGYSVEPLPLPQPAPTRADLDELRERLARAVEDADVAPYLLALEPLFERYDPAEVAAAAVALLRTKEPSAAAAPVPTSQPTSRAGRAWAKLFLSVGDREGLRPGDLLGAILGETGVSRDKVGKIDIRDSFTLVEVDHSVAQQTIQALNGTTIRGRAVRADYDRGGRAGPGGPGGRAGPGGPGGRAGPGRSGKPGRRP